MEKKIFFVSKVNAPPVFNSHWCNFADMKPLLFLIGSTDQLDTFCGTVSQLFEFWLNTSFRPPGKQKTANFCALLWCVCQNLVAKCHDCDVFFVSWGVTRCVFFALFYCCCYFSVTAVADIIFLMLLLLLIFSDATATIVAADVYAVTIFYSADASNFCCSCYCCCCCCCC